MRWRKVLLGVAVAQTLVIANVFAATIEEGVSAYAKGDFGPALKVFTILAQQGDAEAMYNLGLMYWFEEGLPHSEQRATDFFRLAANKGHVEAINELATMYFWKEDHANAARLYRKAAEQGSPRAMANLGGAYLNGHGVPKSATDSVKWYRLAAEKRNIGSQMALALIYEKGWHLRDEGKELPDYVEAARWNLLAADQDNASAQYELAKRYLSGLGVPQDLNSAYMWLTLAAHEKPPVFGSDHRKMGLDSRFSAEKRKTILRERNDLEAKMNENSIVAAKQMVAGWLRTHEDAAMATQK